MFKVKDTDICVCVFKKEINGKYGVTSCDSEGHEGLLADDLINLKELHNLMANVFSSKITCCGTIKSAKQASKILGLA